MYATIVRRRQKCVRIELKVLLVTPSPSAPKWAQKKKPRMKEVKFTIEI